MMRIVGMACVLSCALVSTGAWASAEVRVAIKEPTGALHDASVEVELKNVGEEVAYVLKSDSPFYLPQGHLTGPWFRLSDTSGSAVLYSGRTVVAPPSLGAYVRLEPGQVLNARLRLSDEYDLVQGQTYEVSLPVAVYTDDPRVVPSSPTIVESNVLTLRVNTVFSARKEPDLAADTTIQCKEGQPEQTQKAIVAAQGASWAALNYLSGLYYIDPIDPNNPVTPRVHMTPDFRYTYWFGPYDEGAPQPPEPGGLDTDNSMVDKVVAATYDRLTHGANTVCDSCPGYDPTTRAWAQAALIHLCPVNFEDPITGGISSQAGTIVHEVTHQGDDTAPATVDYPNVKNRAAAHALSRSSAVRSAANYEYFIMDVPRGLLPQGNP